jgi:hypothetical protein
MWLIVGPHNAVGLIMRTDRNLRLLLGAATVAIASSVVGALAFMHRPLPPDGDPVLGGPQLIMFEVDGCKWCEQFRRKTARAYLETEWASKAPLRYMSVDDGPPPKRYRLASFSKSPSLVLFDAYGREVDRIDGEPKDSAAIESLVRRNLRRMAKL